MIETLKSIHACFCKLTNQPDLKYPPCERMLWEFHNAGFTEEDLAIVLEFMLWNNRKREPKYRDRILFHRIIGDLETLNSRLGEAKAWHRNRKPKPSPREQILEATGRPTETPERVYHISDVFKNIGAQV